MSSNWFQQNELSISLCGALCSGCLIYAVIHFINKKFLNDELPMTSVLQIICCITLLLCCVACIEFSKKSKGIAFMLAMTPVLPLNRVYINNYDLNTIILPRAIPIIGNIYDMYRMFISNSLAPDGGWSDKLFPGLPF